MWMFSGQSADGASKFGTFGEYFSNRFIDDPFGTEKHTDLLLSHSDDKRPRLILSSFKTSNTHIKPSNEEFVIQLVVSTQLKS